MDRFPRYKSAKNSASLTWRIQGDDWASGKYAVRFTKENGKGRVAYLTVFDIAEYAKWK